MRRRYGVLLAGLMGISSGTAFGQDMDFSVEGTLDAYYQYIWRGYNLGDRLVLQPGLALGFGETGVSLNVWGSAAVQDRGRPRKLDQFDELDFTLSFDRSPGKESGVDLSVGYTQYTFPSLDMGTKHTEEIYGGVGLDKPLAPGLTVYYDFGVFDAWYITAGIAPEVPLNRDGTATLSLECGIAFGNATRSFGFQNATLTAGVGFTHGIFTFSPTLGYSYADGSVNPDNHEFWGGLSISFSR